MVWPLFYSAPKGRPCSPSLSPLLPANYNPPIAPSPSHLWLCFRDRLFLSLHLFVTCLLFLSLSPSSNLCQWTRLKGSVHVWTNPCVSDGFQPQSLLAQPHKERITLSLALLQHALHVCVFVREHVFVRGRCSKRVNWRTIFFFLHPTSLKVTCFVSSVFMYASLSSVPPFAVCHEHGFSKFSVTVAVVCSNAFHFIYQLWPLDLWLRLYSDFFSSCLYLNSYLHFIACSFQSGFSFEFISIYTFLLWSLLPLEKNCPSLSRPHTESHFLGLRSKLPECSQLSLPSSQMQQCIFTRCVFFSFFPTI